MISQSPVSRVPVSVIRRLIAKIQISFKVDKCTNVTAVFENTNVIVPEENTDIVVLFENTNVVVPFDTTDVGAKCHT